MNALVQQKSFLIGSQKDIQALAEKESARILVISDSHGNHDVLKHILERETVSDTPSIASCDALIFCGDGATDLFSCLESAARDNEFMHAIPSVVAFVEGNGDSDSYPVQLTEPGTGSSYSIVSVPQELMIEAAGQKILISHGHRYDVYYGTMMIADRARALHADIVCYGHTHISAAENRNNILILNPGSCSRPRGGQVPSYAILSLKKEQKSSSFEIINLI